MNRQRDPRCKQKQEAVIALRSWSRRRISEVYDLPEFPQEALLALRPNFEYPEWDWQTVGAFLNQNK
jgi:hypothetical protein